MRYRFGTLLAVLALSAAASRQVRAADDSLEAQASVVGANFDKNGNKKPLNEPAPTSTKENPADSCLPKDPSAGTPAPADKPADVCPEKEKLDLHLPASGGYASLDDKRKAPPPPAININQRQKEASENSVSVMLSGLLSLFTR